MRVVQLIKHAVLRIAYAFIKAFVPIKKGRVYCESFAGLQYSCNPKYITEAILLDSPIDFHIIWSFQNPASMLGLDDRIVKVKKRSIKDFYFLTTAEFIISNIRLNDCNWGWKKRVGQYYIMTWHGSMALKRVEFDAKESLSATYLEKALLDSKSIDLMLSDSKWCTLFMRRAFKYEGEVLEYGLPRNDTLLHPDCVAQNRTKVCGVLGIEENEKLLLYAPTFRVDKCIDNYIFDWKIIIAALESRWSSKFKILIRLHPNMMGIVDTSPMITSSNCLDVTGYPDMQELLCAADVLITDYSSSMFEFAIKKSPCFLFAPDANTYDRGFYFNLRELPFPVSNNESEMAEQICSFNEVKYIEDLHHLFNEVFRYSQKPNSSSRVVEWMKVKQ